MKKILLLIFCFVQISAFSQNRILYYQPSNYEFATKLISKTSLQEDMLFWQKVMEASHVNLYHYISKTQLQQLQDSVLKILSENITHQQALFAMGLLAGSLNEGHIFLPSSSVIDSLYTNHSIRFPFSISEIANGKFIIMNNWTKGGNLSQGDSIIAINGISTIDLYNKYSKLFGGLETWRKQLISLFFSKLLFIDNFQSPYSIKGIKQNGDTVYFAATGLTKQQAGSINNRYSSQNIQQQLPFQFSILNNNIAYIQFNTMNRNLTDSFNHFLLNTFTIIKNKNCEQLIIDIRENSGGDSKLGNALINYISNKPYRFAAGSKWKVSSYYKEFLKLIKSNDSDYLNESDGKIINYKDNALTKPVNSENTFKGSVVVLISPRTFSSANLLADGMKQYKMATFIGEETGEGNNHFGELFEFMLPNTHMVARASTKMFIRASGNEKNMLPVQPDILVKANANSKDDAVLKAAIDWIKK
jgi:hypothetical protein